MRRKAFTLLELVVVLLILGVLAGLSVATFSAVINKSEEKVAQGSLLAVLRESQALIELDGEPIESVRLAVEDLSLNSTLEYSASQFWVSIAAENVKLGVAQKAAKGCTLARKIDDSFQAWSTGNLGSNCSGATALKGPGEGVFAAMPELNLQAVSNLNAAGESSEVSLSWDGVAQANAYMVEYEGKKLITDKPGARIYGFGFGETVVFQVRAIGSGGEQGPASSVTATTRSGVIHDAQMLWRSNNDTLCFGGASSWSYQVHVSGPKAAKGKYQVEVHTANESSPGISPWLKTPLASYLDGVLSTSEKSVCAEAGQPLFDEVKITSILTGEGAPLSKTSSSVLSSEQIQEKASTEPLTPTALEK